MRPLRFLRLLAVVSVLGLLLTACPAEEPEVVEPDPDVEEPDPDPDVDPDDVDEPDPGVLRLGYLLPETGTLAFLGPPMISGVEMAVNEINEAGGVLGNDIELLPADEADDPGIASSAVDRLLAEGVSAVVGAAASGISAAVIDQITGSEVVQCSPSNTAAFFTTYDDGGYYFRNAPSDFMQGMLLADTVVGAGYSQVAVIGRGDTYGEGLVDAVISNLEELGAEVLERIIYDPAAATFDAEVEQVVASGAEAVVMIPFAEGADITRGLLEAGIEPGQMFGADGIASTTWNEEVDPGNPNVVDGKRGTTVHAPVEGEEVEEGDPEFPDRLFEFNPDLDDTLFAAEAYDCVMVIALAAIAAGSADPRDFVGEIVELTRPPGTTCTSFSECAELIEAGEEIDYDGASGPLDYADVGEPDRGDYDVWEWQDAEYVVVVGDYDITNAGKDYRHNDFHIIPRGVIRQLTILPVATVAAALSADYDVAEFDQDSSKQDSEEPADVSLLLGLNGRPEVGQLGCSLEVE
jgi:ABC-type branched-subunit amino acid transport system substrate-binding protein